MASIYEIAKAAGLSPSTVARALRGTGYCSPEKKEKILAVVMKQCMMQICSMDMHRSAFTLSLHP